MSTQQVNYTILFQGRAGSSFLVDALDNHPEIRSHGEIFAHHMGMLQGRSLADSKLQRARQLAKLGWDGTPIDHQAACLDRIWSDPREARVVGFKTKIRDITDPEGLKETIEAEQAKIIVMKRDNLVKQALSRINSIRLYERTKAAHGRGDWNLRDEGDRLDTRPIPVAEFDKWLRFVTFDQQMLEAFAEYVSGPRLELEYNDLLEDRNAWFGSVFDFLGVEDVPLGSDFKKNTSDDLREAIPNYDELAEHYAGTRFEKMFETDGAG